MIPYVVIEFVLLEQHLAPLDLPRTKLLNLCLQKGVALTLAFVQDVGLEERSDMNDYF